MHFQIKNTLKSNPYHIPKHPFTRFHGSLTLHQQFYSFSNLILDSCLIIFWFTIYLIIWQGWLLPVMSILESTWYLASLSGSCSLVNGLLTPLYLFVSSVLKNHTVICEMFLFWFRMGDLEIIPLPIMGMLSVIPANLWN
jgi:hypothetical protein